VRGEYPGEKYHQKILTEAVTVKWGKRGGKKRVKKKNGVVEGKEGSMITWHWLHLLGVRTEDGLKGGKHGK